MLQSLFRYIKGTIRIRIRGYSLERFINLCKYKNIEMWGLIPNQQSYLLYMYAKDFRRIKPFLRKTKTKVTIEEREGLPFFFYSYKKRLCFWMGFFISLFLIYGMSFFLWDISVHGNQSVTSNQIIKYLQTQKVSCGMLKTKIDCNKLSKHIRNDFDNIIWVSVSMNGTKLDINIKEKTDAAILKETDSEPADIISDKSGIIYEIITRNGVPFVKKGDEIEYGTVLVSGAIPITNDAKEVTHYNYVCAEADILVYRIIEYNDFVNQKYEKKIYTKKKRSYPFLKFLDYNINLGPQKNNFENVEIYTSRNTIKITENFQVPITYGTIKMREYNTETFEYSQKEMERILEERFEDYSKKIKEGGTQMNSNNLQYIITSEGLRLTGTIEIIEEVGIHRKGIDLSQSSMIK